jgi:D-mannonate dehydratase
MIRFSFGGGTKALLEKIGEMVDSLNVHGVALCSGSGTVRTIPNDEIIYTFAHLASDAIAQQARNAVRDSMVGSSHIGKHGITYR